MSAAQPGATLAPAAPTDGEAPAFAVRLDNFEGPFDLLLSLIAKHKLDITEIALSAVTDEFLTYLRTDPKFRYTDSQDLLHAYEAMAKRVDPLLPQYFGRLPRMPYGVRPIPAESTAIHGITDAMVANAGELIPPYLRGLAQEYHDAMPRLHRWMSGSAPNTVAHGDYRVDKVTESEVQFTYLPLKTKQSLPL